MNAKSEISDVTSGKMLEQDLSPDSLSDREFSDRLSSLDLKEIFLILKNISDRDRIEAAETEVIRRHIGLVKSIARKRYGYHVPGMEREDKESLGLIGLLAAVRKYDPDRNVPFPSWAYRCISSHIFDGMRSQGWVPRNRVVLFRRLREIRDSGARLSKKKEAEFQLIKSRLVPMDSLDRPVPTMRNVSLGDTLEDLESDPDEVLDAILEREKVSASISALTGREKDVLHLIFTENLTAAETGRRLGISGERVAQIRKAALEKLRTCPVLRSV